MKIWFNMTIQKSILKRLWFLKEIFHIKVDYWMLHYILNPYRQFGMEFDVNLFIFYDSSLLINPYFYTSKFNVKSGCTFIEKYYIGIFIIKSLMYNQFQKKRLVSFIVCYRCPKKRNFAKMGIVTQKVIHLNVHSPTFNNIGIWHQSCILVQFAL
jgi:hypothetical protein